MEVKLTCQPLSPPSQTNSPRQRAPPAQAKLLQKSLPSVPVVMGVAGVKIVAAAEIEVAAEAPTTTVKIIIVIKTSPTTKIIRPNHTRGVRNIRTYRQVLGGPVPSTGRKVGVLLIVAIR